MTVFAAREAPCGAGDRLAFHRLCRGLWSGHQCDARVDQEQVFLSAFLDVFPGCQRAIRRVCLIPLIIPNLFCGGWTIDKVFTNQNSVSLRPYEGVVPSPGFHEGTCSRVLAWGYQATRLPLSVQSPALAFWLLGSQPLREASILASCRLFWGIGGGWDHRTAFIEMIWGIFRLIYFLKFVHAFVMYSWTFTMSRSHLMVLTWRSGSCFVGSSSTRGICSSSQCRSHRGDQRGFLAEC